MNREYEYYTEGFKDAKLGRHKKNEEYFIERETMTEDEKCLEFLDRLANLLEEYNGVIAFNGGLSNYDDSIIGTRKSRINAELMDHIHHGNLKKEIARLKESNK
jgi:hypothetical protein